MFGLWAVRSDLPGSLHYGLSNRAAEADQSRRARRRLISSSDEKAPQE
jgi:hypothetical protein